jgi:two-component system nitrate/nitrite response regulator NarL
MTKKIRVTILDDHQSIIDGYLFRLSKAPEIEVVAAIAFGEELEPALAKFPTDVLLLDVSVPMSPNNLNPYPILHIIPELLQLYPNLAVLVISMLAERGLVRAIMEAGASGYILKDDQATIQELGNVVISIANGGIRLSQKAHQSFLNRRAQETDELLTARQLQALSLCAAYPNYLTEDLAQKMSVSNSTVRNLLSGAYVRLAVHTRIAAIEKARELGVITPGSQPRLG